MKNTSDRENRITRLGRAAFAKQNDWKFTTAWFSTQALRLGKSHDGSARLSRDGNHRRSEVMDHAEFYRDKEGRAACILVHLYGPHEPAIEFACEKDLRVEVNPDRNRSWWFPGQTIMVAYTRLGIAVMWPDYMPEPLTPTNGAGGKPPPDTASCPSPVAPTTPPTSFSPCPE